jgi:hypothetical protein
MLVYYNLWIFKVNIYALPYSGWPYPIYIRKYHIGCPLITKFPIVDIVVDSMGKKFTKLVDLSIFI